MKGWAEPGLAINCCGWSRGVVCLTGRLSSRSTAGPAGADTYGTTLLASSQLHVVNCTLPVGNRSGLGSNVYMHSVKVHLLLLCNTKRERITIVLTSVYTAVSAQYCCAPGQSLVFQQHPPCVSTKGTSVIL